MCTHLLCNSEDEARYLASLYPDKRVFITCEKQSFHPYKVIVPCFDTLGELSYSNTVIFSGKGKFALGMGGSNVLP